LGKRLDLKEGRVIRGLGEVRRVLDQQGKETRYGVEREVPSKKKEKVDLA